MTGPTGHIRRKDWATMMGEHNTMNRATGAPAAGKLLVSPREAARMLSISERTLYSLTKAGEIPALKLVRAVRYRVADLEAWVERKIRRDCA
jgi:excisionase family DNA binding protein